MPDNELKNNDELKCKNMKSLQVVNLLVCMTSLLFGYHNFIQHVHNIIQRFRESGTISVRKGQGRKTILDARDLRALRRHCITYRNAAVMEITTWAQEYFQKTLSVNTIHRAIRRRRIKLYRSKKKPYLNMIQERRRFLWAKAHLKWTVAKWKTVLWSDQSKFEVLFGKLGRHVIRTKEDKDNPSRYQRSVQKPASLMAAVMMQDSVYEVQKLLIVEEETLLTDTDRKVGDRRLCQWNVEQRDSDHSEEMDRMKTEKEELEVQLQQWAERSQALRKEEVGVEQERRRIQQDEKRIRKERERMQRKLHLSQLNSTNRQRSLSIIPLDK
ncbi:hypothetical protein QTP70_016300 [Hemibagrus guttatus]|uniref:Transposase n=1 Tax=Hemibagrus guttatus TaxID=175788 RepID=A0AAE0Q515_9TELE|nr:hypothetical protein QTP70_016300 [Hemibagrus guttatus]